MIPRKCHEQLHTALERQAAVALIGPRQVGKTTLALQMSDESHSVYLDLESPSDRMRCSEPELLFQQLSGKLIILDEIHRMPEIFPILRGIIDKNRRKGHKTNQFLLLGSASMELLRHSSESLAGRLSVVDLWPFDLLEVEHIPSALERLWLRGGFPDSFLAPSDEESAQWREDFIRTYVEREIPLFGGRIPAETLYRLWSMLAHSQGTLLNQSRLAQSLGMSGQSIGRYIDLLVDLFLVYRLMPFQSNLGKRLTKAPKIYIRDSGLLHSLLHVTELLPLLGHPILGASWEGFVIDQIIKCAPQRTLSSFYRSTGGAEIDLVLELPQKGRWAIEIKRSLSPKLEKGFYYACEDVKPDRCCVIYPGTESYPLAEHIQVMGLATFLKEMCLEKESKP